MSKRGVERVLNLIMTIGSRRGIDRQRLFSVIPEYAEAKDDDSREKMFERDKELIRDLGIPLETVPDMWDPSIVEYRIGSGTAAGDLDVTDAEYTILLAASRAWDDTAAGGAARRVRAKLQTYPHSADEDLLRSAGRASVESLPVLSPLLEAVTHARAVTFLYRRSDGTAATRTVEPWSVGVVDGYWYVLGFDRDRQAQRVFRASRIGSFPRISGVARAQRPDRVDLRDAISGAAGPSEKAPSRLRAAPWKALGLREELGADLETETLELPARRRTAVERLVRADARWVELLEPAAWREELHRTFATIEQAHRAPADLAAVETAPPRPTPRIRVSSSGGDRVARLVSLASYVQQVGEARIEDLAERFGVSEKQLRADLELLFLCGDLGSGWEDLIEVEWEGGFVRVRNADPLRRRFRLTRSEAIALLAGIGALGQLSGEEGEIAASVQAKLTAIVGSDGAGTSAASAGGSDDGRVGEPAAAAASDAEAAQHAASATEHAASATEHAASGTEHAVSGTERAAGESRRDAVLAVIRQAIREQRQVCLLHSPPERPGAQERLLLPSQLETEHGRSYVRGTIPAPASPAGTVDGASSHGHSRAAAAPGQTAERVFRIDRIVAADLAEPCSPADSRSCAEQHSPACPQHHASNADVARPAEVPRGILAREDQPVWLRLEGPAQWIAEAFEAVEMREAEGSGTYARLEHPVRSALLDAVLEAGGAAELLAPPALREAVAVTAGAARAVHAGEPG